MQLAFQLYITLNLQLVLQLSTLEMLTNKKSLSSVVVVGPKLSFITKFTKQMKHYTSKA